jgi:hypothetical protein
MKQILFLITFAVTIGYAQITLRGSMGIKLDNASSIYDYLNVNYAGSQQLSNFQTMVEFEGEINYLMSSALELSFNLDYSMNSFTFDYGVTRYECDYHQFAPSLGVYKKFPGEGYFFRIGGGVGPRFFTFNEKLPSITQVIPYSGTGIGIYARADGSTQISSRAFAYIGIDIKYDHIGSLKDNSGIILKNNFYAKEVNGASFTCGVKLGISYIINL